MGTPTRPDLALVVDGAEVTVPDDGASLLEVLRDRVGLRSAKDGCSPQGQCGCCTVLVDGQPRVSCVTPARRVAGRAITTLDGLDDPIRQRWGAAFASTGGSQCGFCTPGIIVRFAGLHDRGIEPDDPLVARSLHAHLCRCTGWQTVVEAYAAFHAAPAPGDRDRDWSAATARAAIEGGATQLVGPDIALGHGGFADDTSPLDARVAVPDGAGGWGVGETLTEARTRAGKVQGRRTTAETRPPLAVPPGGWDARLATSWVEPAYLETDASWCEPGGEPMSPLANGGAFGGKQASPVAAAARQLADLHDRPVRVLFGREDTVRLGPKRPPLAGGATADGRGAVVVARTPGVTAAIGSVAPGLAVEEVPVAGPPTSLAPRGAAWAEALALLAGARGSVGRLRAPSGSTAEAELVDGRVRVRVACGDPLDQVTLRSYCVGAAHMAYSMVTSEGLAVDDDGDVDDLTVRSFGVVRATETPPIEVEIDDTPGEPVNGSDGVFAAVLAATWLDRGCPPTWPTG